MSEHTLAGIGARSQDAQRSLSRKLRFTLLFGSLFFAWLLFNRVNPTLRNVIGNVAGTSIAFLSIFWSLQGAFRRRNPASQGVLSSGQWRRVWGINFLSLGLIGYGLGNAIWSYYELVLHQEPFPSWADAAYLPGVACTLTGILLLPSRPMPVALRGRILLDSLMTMAAMVTFSWYFLLGPTVLAGGETLLTRILSVAYPIAGLTLLLCILILSARQEAGIMRGRNYVTIGLFCYMVTDALFGYFTLQGTYATGHPLDIGWMLANLFIALGIIEMRAEVAAAATAEEQKENVPQRNPVLWRSLLPYALIPAVGALLVYVQMKAPTGPLAQGVHVGSAALIGLILIRQVFALIENNRLYRYVQEAYREVETKNLQLEVKTKEAVSYAENLEQLNEELHAMQEELEENVRALAAANTRLEALATTDGMTGLPNHRTFQERLRIEMARCQRIGSPLSVMLLDVDKFKQYNDAYGHPAGDEALRIVARLMRETVRETDLPARYGGEEFAILLPDTPIEQAHQVAERLRAAIEAYRFPNRPVTVSIGVAYYIGEENSTEVLITSADEALYAAKHRGRNQVLIWNQDLKANTGIPEEFTFSLPIAA
jgi:diguanylate cyclase (GGDEF)-like protein